MRKRDKAGLGFGLLLVFFSSVAIFVFDLSTRVSLANWTFLVTGAIFVGFSSLKMTTFHAAILLAISGFAGMNLCVRIIQGRTINEGNGSSCSHRFRRLRSLTMSTFTS